MIKTDKRQHGGRRLPLTIALSEALMGAIAGLHIVQQELRRAIGIAESYPLLSRDYRAEDEPASGPALRRARRRAEARIRRLRALLAPHPIHQLRKRKEAAGAATPNRLGA